VNGILVTLSGGYPEGPGWLLGFTDDGRYGIVVLEGGLLSRPPIEYITVERPNTDFPNGYAFSRVQAKSKRAKP
jgi:hypothetical protein